MSEAMGGIAQLKIRPHSVSCSISNARVCGPVRFGNFGKKSKQLYGWRKALRLEVRTNRCTFDSLLKSRVTCHAVDLPWNQATLKFPKRRSRKDAPLAGDFDIERSLAF